VVRSYSFKVEKKIFFKTFLGVIFLSDVISLVKTMREIG